MTTTATIAVGSYQIGSPLQSGTYGAVFRALSANKSPAVIKMDRGRTPLTAEVVNFQNFDQVRHRLKLRAVVGSSNPMLVLDRLPAPDILAVMRQRPNMFTFTQMMEIAKQGLEFLADAEAAGMIHGDLKCNNMSFSPDSHQLTIFDYGCSGKAGETPITKILQAAPYRSPEVVLQGEATPALDMWSFGCCLYYLMTGEDFFPVRFLPSDRDTSLSDNQHLHMMIDNLGWPSVEFLKRTKWGNRFFCLNLNGKLELRKLLQPVGTPAPTAAGNCFFQSDRLNVLEAALRKQNVTDDQIKEVVLLLSQMIRFEGRSKPSDLLQAPLLQDDISFRIEFPTDLEARNDKISFHRSSDIDITQFPSSPPLMIIDRETRFNALSYNLPKDPNNKYWISIVRHGERVLIQEVTIADGDRIKIESSDEGVLSIAHRDQAQAVQAVYASVAKNLFPEQERRVSIPRAAKKQKAPVERG